MTRTVLITGASSGIGAALAARLARRGDRLLLVARREAELSEVADEVAAAGGTSRVLPTDLRVPEEVDALLAGVADEPPDVLVCSAGISIARPVLEQLDRWHDLDRSMRANFLGHAQLVLGLLPAMLERGSGQVVAVSTPNAHVPTPGWGAYCASKAALDAWLRSIGPELRRVGVQVSTVELGVVRTPMSRPTYGEHPPFALSADRAAGRIERVLDRPRVLTSPAWARAAAVSAAVAPVALPRAIGWFSVRGSRR